MSIDTPLSPHVPASRPAARVEPARVEGFVREYHAFTWRVLRRCGLPPEDADDAAQQVFLIATDRLDSIEPGSERAFLYRTAARVASNMRRSLRRRRDAPGLEEGEEPAPLAAPDELLDQRRARDLLDRILGELTEDLRAIFVLFEIEGLRSPEIAEALDIPLGTVASRLRRARAEVEQRVAHYRNVSRSKGNVP